MINRTVAGEELLWCNNTLIAIQVAASDSEDGICVVEHHLPYGDPRRCMCIATKTSCSISVKGGCVFRSTAMNASVGAGETVIAPKGLAHTFRVESPGGRAHAHGRRAVRISRRCCEPGEPPWRAAGTAAAG